jgi:hypothetical protein
MKNCPAESLVRRNKATVGFQEATTSVVSGSIFLNSSAAASDRTVLIKVGPANIREGLLLDRSGNNYVGTFTIDQFDLSGNTLAHIAGQITGTRITVDRMTYRW